MSTQTRLQRLEALEAIRALKARYLAACDAKDPETMRACFADGRVAIDYGPVGNFDNADALVDVFRQIGCHEHMVEMHHGVHPRIEIVDDTHARGQWGLHYQLINTQDMTLTQLAGGYDDEYGGFDGEWKITATRFTVHSCLVLQLGEDALRRLHAGRRPPGPEI